MVEALFQGSLFFVTGAAVIIGVVGLVYGISWFFDRISGSAESLLTPEELEQRRVATALVRHAGLAGMLPEEQNRVMRHFFEESSHPYVKDPVADDDIEAQKNEVEPSIENVRSHEEESAAKTKLDGDDEKTSSVEKEPVPEAMDDIDIETDSESRLEENTEDVKESADEEATDVEAGTENETTSATEEVEKKIEFTSEDGDNSQSEETRTTTQKAPDAVEGNPACISLSDLPSSHSISHILKLEDQKEVIEEDDVEKQFSEAEDQDEDGASKKSEEEEGVCPICLSEYEDDEKIVIGSSCGHMYHSACFMQWMEKKHNECPFCRTEMMTSDEFLATAYDVLGEDRVNKLKNINDEAARRLTAWYAKHPLSGESSEASPTVQAPPQPPTVQVIVSGDLSA